jgi:uncharacterized protein with GYD domain
MNHLTGRHKKIAYYNKSFYTFVRVRFLPRSGFEVKIVSNQIIGGVTMPKYLVEATYTLEGVKGFLKEGGSKRREAVEAAIKSAGGKLEAFYFAFGEPDALAILDLPDNSTAAAASLAFNATGAVRLKTVVLLTPEEMDQANKKSVNYRPPGR